MQLKGLNEWWDCASASIFTNRFDLARAVYNRFGSSWKRHIQLSRAARMHEVEIERRMIAERADRDARLPRRPPNLELLR